MNDPVNGSRLATAQTAQGERQFKLLSASDRVKITNRLRAQRKDEIRANIKESGISADKAFEALNVCDSRRITSSDRIDFAMTDAGRLQSILLSLQKDKPDATDADVDALGLDQVEETRLVANLHGLDVKPRSKDEKENPTPPGASEAPGMNQTSEK